MFYGYGILNNHVPTLKATVMGSIVWDADALSFIASASITDATQKSAVNTLVKDLKTASIWTKMKAIYPMIGGSASSHKFNLKDPRDLDAAFRLTFSGGWAHSSTGALPNGTTAYANTFLSPLTHLTLFQSHLSYCSRTSALPLGYQAFMGAYSRSSENGYTGNGNLSIAINGATSNLFCPQHSEISLTHAAYKLSTTDTLGFHLNTRTSSATNSLKFFKNGTLLGQSSTNSGGEYLNDQSIYLGAYHTKYVGFDNPQQYTDRECSFSSIGAGLTDAESLNFYNAVNTFNTTLGR
jgi:hypothetical protein